MIGPGLVVAFTLTSSHATSPDGAAESAPGVPARLSRAVSAAPAEAGALGFGSGLTDALAAAAAPRAPGQGETEQRGRTFPELLAALAEGAAVHAATTPGVVSSVTVDDEIGAGAEARGATDSEAEELAPLLLAGLPTGLAGQVPPQVQPLATAPAEAVESSPLDPGMLRGLSRGFASRLQRVADRMWNESGLRLEVVEGYRTQARQQALFTQGRTAPGPVVTWTRSSLHTEGLAADVYIDGAPVTQADALLLSRIAREEGLKTLYPVDSGHIQLSGAADDAGPEGPLDRARPSPSGAGVGAPRTGVAPVAPVAPVARPARPGVIGMEPPAPDLPTGASSPPLPLTDVAATNVIARASSRTPRDPGGHGATASAPGSHPAPAPSREVAHPVSPVVSSAGTAPEPPTREGREATPTVTGSDRSSAPVPEEVTSARPSGLPAATLAGGARAEAPATVGAVGRTAPVDPARFEAPAAAGVYRRLHVPIDGPEGAGSLHVGMRGGSVDATLNVVDPVLAGELRGRLHELRQQLAARGIEARDLGVRVVSEAAPDASVRLHAAADPRGGASTGSGGGGTDPGLPQGRAGRFLDSRDEHEGRTSRHGEPDEEERP